MVTIPSGTTKFVLSASGEYYELLKGDVLENLGTAIFSDALIDHSQIRVEGQVRSYTAEAILTKGSDMIIRVAPGPGLVSGVVGVQAMGAFSLIQNEGRISGVGAGSKAVIATGEGNTIYNGEGAMIEGDTAVEYRLGHFMNYGLVMGTTIGVNMISQSGQTTSFVNDDLGFVTVGSASKLAIKGGEGNDRVENGGLIVGSISLGGGNDSFECVKGLNDQGLAVQGTIDGTVYGGKGDDKYHIVGKIPKLVEYNSEGHDKVISSVNFQLGDYFEELVLSGDENLIGLGNSGDNILRANNGDSKLAGMAGNDMIFGGTGNDQLAGGAGKDTFYFATQGGTDLIGDFKNGEDLIDLAGLLPGKDYNYLLTNNLVSAQGTDIHIKFGSDELILKNVTLAQLDKTDFNFV